MPVTSVDDIFLMELQDIYSAEKQLEEALPKQAEAAGSETLRKLFTEHTEQTRGQIERLEQIFEMLDEEPGDESCEAMEGLVEEAEQIMEEVDQPELRDVALIAAAQKVEHYEMASYGTLRTLAESMGLKEAASLLEKTLDEEKRTDARLTKVAESEVNRRALELREQGEQEEQEESGGAKRGGSRQANGQGAGKQAARSKQASGGRQASGGKQASGAKQASAKGESKRAPTKAAGGSKGDDLKSREYRDEKGNVRHHTRSYMEQHGGSGGKKAAR